MKLKQYSKKDYDNRVESMKAAMEERHQPKKRPLLWTAEILAIFALGYVAIIMFATP